MHQPTRRTAPASVRATIEAGKRLPSASLATSAELAEEFAVRYARLNRPIVLVGPVGSGKSTLARRIHDLSGRPGQIISVSAGELTDQLYADVLFGHVGGAFTGATGARRGAFELASNGTLLLDDVSFMRSEAQSAILRAIEDRSIRPLGASRDILITSREVYAMTEHPDDLIDRDILLPDLKSRMGEFIIELPGLAERVADIPNLSRCYAEEFAREHGLMPAVLPTQAALDAMAEYWWPGNLRELRGVIERGFIHAVAAGSHSITREHLPTRVLQPRSAPRPKRLTPELARYALSAAGGNKTKAAESLGVHRNTLSRFLRECVA